MTPEERANLIIRTQDDINLYSLLVLHIRESQREAVEKSKLYFLNMLKNHEVNWHDFIAEESSDAQSLIEALIDDTQELTPEKVLVRDEEEN